MPDSLYSPNRRHHFSIVWKYLTSPMSWRLSSFSNDDLLNRRLVCTWIHVDWAGQNVDCISFEISLHNLGLNFDIRTIWHVLKSVTCDSMSILKDHRKVFKRCKWNSLTVWYGTNEKSLQDFGNSLESGFVIFILILQKTFEILPKEVSDRRFFVERILILLACLASESWPWTKILVVKTRGRSLPLSNFWSGKVYRSKVLIASSKLVHYLNPSMLLATNNDRNHFI